MGGYAEGGTPAVRIALKAWGCRRRAPREAKESSMKCPHCKRPSAAEPACSVCNQDMMAKGISTSMYDPGYWEEKMADERDAYARDEAEEHDRMFPTEENY